MQYLIDASNLSIDSILLHLDYSFMIDTQPLLVLELSIVEWNTIVSKLKFLLVYLIEFVLMLSIVV